MKTKLLKRVRKEFSYSYDYEKKLWYITSPGKKLFRCQTTHKAVDYMCCKRLSVSEFKNWYYKIWHLHGEWGVFSIDGKMPLNN